jgi:radical SAM protein with 4Fe4S-binding SPASM domain
VRLTPRVIGGIPDLLDRAAEEGWATVTVHCPVCTGRSEGVWPEGADQIAALEPVFEHFLGLSEHWVIETNTPWAKYHPLMRKLSKRTTVAHEGCGGGRWRLAIGASGWISTCICLDLPAFRIANVRTDNIGEVFRDSRFAKLMRAPQEYGLCTDCPNVTTCGAGCRAAAYALTGDPEGLDLSCPVRQARMRAAQGTPT